MATRRPNMPRVRPAGSASGPNAATPPDRGTGEGDRAATASAGQRGTGPSAVNRSKVVPLGAAPGYDGESTPGTTGTSGTGRATPARKPIAGSSAAGNSAATTSGTGVPASPRPAVKRPGKRPGGAQEKRLRERAELSGAIRSGAGSGRGSATGSGNGSGSRPAETAQANTGDSSPVPARAFSGRMLALAVILAVVTVLLLPSVGTYMDQRAEIAQLQASIAEKQQKQADLKTQIARWDDPAYVKAQARNRINLVMPGEKKYMVIGATGDDSAVGPQSVGDVRTDLPWVDSLWDTVVRSATD